MLLVPLLLQAAPKPTPPVKRPQAALPELKTQQDKMLFLEMIRTRFPAIRQGKNSTFAASDLDEMLERYVSRGTSTPFAPLVDDQTFIRRIYIDLTGRYPTPAEIQSFVEDKDGKKRPHTIDRLLESDAFSRKWARYWRAVIFQDSGAESDTVNPQALEDWLFEEFKKNTPWDRIVAELISASPERRKNVMPKDNGWNQNTGQNNFILACNREPQTIASQTARIFMGISIGCSECHDHPFDKWKREQFHEMAAFFAPGKYYMTEQDDPSKKIEMQPKFLLGEDPGVTLSPDQRRVAVAAYLVYNPDNYWFARAFVNRMWNELLGDGFYSVDSLGPDKECVHQLVANRIGATFRYAGFDIRWLFRTIANSRAYQREIGTIHDDADLFTSVRPSRLRPYEVADNVEHLVGANAGLRRQVQVAFEQNPSIPQRDLEGSIQQALLMMNNTLIQNHLANGELKKRVAAIGDDQGMIQAAFLEVLARTPTPEESGRFLELVRNSNNRDEAVSDLLWILVNSAEFVTKR